MKKLYPFKFFLSSLSFIFLVSNLACYNNPATDPATAVPYKEDEEVLIKEAQDKLTEKENQLRDLKTKHGNFLEIGALLNQIKTLKEEIERLKIKGINPEELKKILNEVRALGALNLETLERNMDELGRKLTQLKNLLKAR